MSTVIVVVNSEKLLTYSKEYHAEALLLAEQLKIAWLCEAQEYYI